MTSVPPQAAGMTQPSEGRIITARRAILIVAGLLAALLLLRVGGSRTAPLPSRAHPRLDVTEASGTADDGVNERPPQRSPPRRPPSVDTRSRDSTATLGPATAKPTLAPRSTSRVTAANDVSPEVPRAAEPGVSTVPEALVRFIRSKDAKCRPPRATMRRDELMRNVPYYWRDVEDSGAVEEGPSMERPASRPGGDRLAIFISAFGSPHNDGFVMKRLAPMFDRVIKVGGIERTRWVACQKETWGQLITCAAQAYLAAQLDHPVTDLTIIDTTGADGTSPRSHTLLNELKAALAVAASNNASSRPRFDEMGGVLVVERREEAVSDPCRVWRVLEDWLFYLSRSEAAAWASTDEAGAVQRVLGSQKSLLLWHVPGPWLPFFALMGGTLFVEEGKAEDNLVMFAEMLAQVRPPKPPSRNGGRRGASPRMSLQYRVIDRTGKVTIDQSISGGTDAAHPPKGPPPTQQKDPSPPPVPDAEGERTSATESARSATTRAGHALSFLPSRLMQFHPLQEKPTAWGFPIVNVDVPAMNDILQSSDLAHHAGLPSTHERRPWRLRNDTSGDPTTAGVDKRMVHRRTLPSWLDPSVFRTPTVLIAIKNEEFTHRPQVVEYLDLMQRHFRSLIIVTDKVSASYNSRYADTPIWCLFWGADIVACLNNILKRRVVYHTGGLLMMHGDTYFAPKEFLGYHDTRHILVSKNHPMTDLAKNYISDQPASWVFDDSSWVGGPQFARRPDTNYASLREFQSNVGSYFAPYLKGLPAFKDYLMDTVKNVKFGDMAYYPNVVIDALTPFVSVTMQTFPMSEMFLGYLASMGSMFADVPNDGLLHAGGCCHGVYEREIANWPAGHKFDLNKVPDTGWVNARVRNSFACSELWRPMTADGALRGDKQQEGEEAPSTSSDSEVIFFSRTTCDMKATVPLTLSSAGGSGSPLRTPQHIDLTNPFTNAVALVLLPPSAGRPTQPFRVRIRAVLTNTHEFTVRVRGATNAKQSFKSLDGDAGAKIAPTGVPIKLSLALYTGVVENTPVGVAWPASTKAAAASSAGAASRRMQPRAEAEEDDESLTGRAAPSRAYPSHEAVTLGLGDDVLYVEVQSPQFDFIKIQIDTTSHTRSVVTVVPGPGLASTQGTDAVEGPAFLRWSSRPFRRGGSAAKPPPKKAR